MSAYLLALVLFAGETDVIKIANTYSDGGGYNWTAGNSGVPEELRFKGRTILKKGQGGTYCCGFTLAVAMRVASERGLLADKTFEQLRQFQKQWYGVDDQSGGTLCVYAVEQLGIGSAVEHPDARPGDMVQFWRSNKSGHSVIFLSWVEQDGRRIGFRYRSSQKSTNGIGNKTEYFADVSGRGGKVLRERTYICRLAK